MVMDFNSSVSKISPLFKDHMNDLKEFLTEDVCSRRTMSQITKFEEIVNVLIKRDIIDPSTKKWSRLNEICQHFLNKSFQEAANAPSPCVVDFIAAHIGYCQWRRFARILHITEFEIERIEKHHEDAGACVREVLKLYPEHTPCRTPVEINAVLLDALKYFNSGMVGTVSKILAECK